MKSSIYNGYCAPYKGSVCKRFLKKPILVYYNHTETEDEELEIESDKFNFPQPLNEKITGNLWGELISPLLEPCKSAASALLCHYAFPSCGYTLHGAVSKPLCREDCIAVRDLFCFNQWAMIEDNKHKGIYFKSREHFRLPDCDSLPSHNDKSNSNCTKVHLTEIRKEEVTFDCIQDRGRYYQGHKNVTKSGINCQKWVSQEPHAHNRPPFVFPEILNAENYCRNAGGEEPVPWCYTVNPKIRWEHCDIPFCEKNRTILGEANLSDLNKPGTLGANFPSSQSFIITPTFILLLSSLVLISLTLILVITALCYRIQKFRHRGYKSTSSCDPEIDLNKLPSNFAYHCTAIKLNPKLEALEFPRNDIIYVRDIGEGAFGRVFQARVHGIKKDEEFTYVAVKMLKDEANEEDQLNFEREACLMADFDHPNIVTLLGVCAIGKPMCLIFEYMGKGDLNNFLRSSSPSKYQALRAEPSRPRYRLSLLDLINIGMQISSGMVYLSEKKFVHRDLATRNCLVNDNLMVKIADFGLSQKVNAANYYTGSQDDAIPIRWMPLESILYNKFTIESDVWAFGVVLWEIFSFALQPYYGMTHEEVVDFIKNGNVLSCPQAAPSPIYQLMKLCWSKKASNRPSFKSIHQTLSSLYFNIKSNQTKDNQPFNNLHNHTQPSKMHV